MERRTRIVATLGPATDRPGVLGRLLELGLDVARINFSHSVADEAAQRIARLRELARGRQRPVAVLADLPGPKVRARIDAPLELTEGSETSLARSAQATAPIHLTEPEFLAEVRPGHRVLLDDGRLQLRVVAVEADVMRATVEAGGTLLPNKGVNFPDTTCTLPALTDRDHEALAAAAAAGVDWLALSFVRGPAAADEVRAAAARHGLHVPVLAKIERPEAVEHHAAIIAAFDGIMVARGDLGVEIPLEKVPQVQKRLISAAREAGKPVVTATDMLDSMRHNPRPTRAEASDVANAVYDGTDAVMLSGETAVGEFPVAAVACMDRIAREAEASLEVDSSWRDVHVPRREVQDHWSHLACALAQDVGAEAVVTPTDSGRTARLMARHRPPLLLLAPTPSEATARQLALVWGVVPLHAEPPAGAAHLTTAAAVRAAWQLGALREGVRVVVLAREEVEGGAGVPTLRVVRVGPGGSCQGP